MHRVRTLCLSAAAIFALEAAAFASPANLMQPSTLPFQAPPFNKIKDADFQPAFDAAMDNGLKEFDAIANNPAAAHLREHDRGDGKIRSRADPRAAGVFHTRRRQHR